MEIKELFIHTNQLLTERMIQVIPEQFALPAPLHIRYSDQLTLRDAINVQAHENASVPRVLAGEADISANYEFKEDILPDNFVADFQQLSDEANASIRSFIDMERIVHLSYGDFPARDYIRDIAIERGITAYDTAKLLEIKAELPEDVVQRLWDIISPIAEFMRSMGIFPPTVPVDANAPLEYRLLGLVGRNPSEYLR